MSLGIARKDGSVIHWNVSKSTENSRKNSPNLCEVHTIMQENWEFMGNPIFRLETPYLAPYAPLKGTNCVDEQVKWVVIPASQTS